MRDDGDAFITFMMLLVLMIVIALPNQGNKTYVDSCEAIYETIP